MPAAFSGEVGIFEFFRVEVVFDGFAVVHVLTFVV